MIGTASVQAKTVAAQVVKYRRDFRVFAQEQLKISGTPISFWPCQIPLLESVERQMADRGFVRSIWLKSRQVGASTLAQALIAWRAMLWPNINAVVIADQAERSRTLFDIAKSFYEQMDESIRPVGRYVSKRELFFANPSRVSGFRDPGLRSRIVVDSAHKKNIAIGANWSAVHLSECARFPDPKFVLDGVIPAVHRVPGTMIIIESSAEMSGTWYRDFFEASQRGETGFDAVFVPWFLQPEYYLCPVCYAAYPTVCQDPAHEVQAKKIVELDADEQHIITEYHLRLGHIVWMREKLSEMGNDWNLFRQNFPLEPDDAWVTPGAQAFPAKALRELRKQTRAPVRMANVHPGPRILDAPDGNLWLWEEPQVGKSYDIGCDVSSGVGESDSILEDDRFADWSVACVLERGSNRQVAEWRSKRTDPFELASMLYWLGTYYNTAQVAIETNGVGGGTNAQLSKLGFANVYCLTPEHRVLTADMRWIAIGDLKLGENLLGFDEKIPMAGLRRRYHPSAVYGIEPRHAEIYRIVLSDGTELKSTGEHLWLTRSPRSNKQEWKPTVHLKIGDRFPRLFPTWNELTTKEAGWMEGIIDGEASAGFYHNGDLSSTHVQRHLSINQNPGLIFDRICQLLRKWGFVFSVGEQHKGSVCMRARISRKIEVARLFGMVRPQRLLPKLTPAWFNAVMAYEHETVVSIEKAGHTDVVMFGTSTSTYVAEGFPSHNCWRYRDEVVPRYSKKTGWETNSKSKPWLIGFAIHEMSNERVQIRSEILLREMEHFVQKGPREWGAVAGQHDDHVLSWMIALLASDDECFERYYGLQREMNTARRGGEVVVERSRVPEDWECDRSFLKLSHKRLEVTPWE